MLNPVNGKKGDPASMGNDAKGNAHVLAPCPETPNCVSSMCDDAEHGMQAISFDGDWRSAKKQLLQVIDALPRTRIVADQENYIHVEVRSLLFRFVDDVEFLFDVQGNQIHFRSASRMGRGDLGVNRRRMEKIREKFAGR